MVSNRETGAVAQATAPVSLVERDERNLSSLATTALMIAHYFPYLGSPVGLEGANIRDNLHGYLWHGSLRGHPQIFAIGIERTPGVVSPAALLRKPQRAGEADVGV